MKRFGLLLALLVLSLSMTGCGADAGNGATNVGPVADDSNLPSEVKEYEARRANERAAKQLPKAPKSSPRKR